jgi:hypothetical protein
MEVNIMRRVKLAVVPFVVLGSSARLDATLSAAVEWMASATEVYDTVSVALYLVGL